MQIQFITGMDQLSKDDWNRLIAPDYPFLKLEFLSGLEATGCCTPATGWHPCHAVWRESDGKIAALMPLYLKDHSWGEYVFDGGWAHAYQSHGLSYYPKLLTAIPFTPVPGPRILVAKGVDAEHCMQQWTKALPEVLASFQASGWHRLFPNSRMATEGTGYLERQDCQFHWHNKDYRHFDDILADFTSRKRKNIRKERDGISAAGIRVTRHTGSDITTEMMETFYQFYQNTYFIRGHRPHLNAAFFQHLLTTMADSLCLVLAIQNDTAIAGSLFFFDADHLYGRYWGALQDVPGLHFECCYYQGMDFCIERQIKTFNPGTQGEHKISRGFEPQQTHSEHWVVDQAFYDAIDRFLIQEKRSVGAYMQEAAKLLPFNQERRERDLK